MRVTEKSASAFSSNNVAAAAASASTTRDSAASKISKISKSAHPSGPWTAPRDPGNHSISFQFPPPGSSTKSAFQLPPPGSSTKFHHQAAAPNQHQLPASTTRQQHHISQPPARQPANQLLTLLPCHTHTMAARSVVV